MRLALGFLLLASCASAAPAPAPVAPPVPPAHRSPSPPPAPPPPAPKDVAAKTPEEALARLFTAERIDAAWFAKAFSDAVPAAKVEAIVVDIRKDLGAYAKVEKSAAGFDVVLAKGKVPAKITLDSEGRIASLWFSPPELTAVMSLKEIEAEAAALPGKVSYLVLTDGAEVAARDADQPLAVGSAFKLAVLEALRERIEAKKAQWSDVVRLDAKHKSLPSGSLHTWPDRAPVTLHTLASLMISVSDNTATDALVDYVGRDAAEKHAPGNAPFMTTRDAFVLKSKTNAALLARWRAADPAARRKMIPEITAAKLVEGDGIPDPTVDVEWMMSARRLCDLLSRTKNLDVMRINPGVATRKDWDLVAYKGGSEPGVFNLSTWVEKAGKKHCVVTTWNDPAKEVEQSRLSTLHGALLRSLAEPRK